MDSNLIDVGENGDMQLIFSKNQQVHTSCWSDYTVSLALAQTDTQKLVVDDGSGKMAYFIMLLIRDGSSDQRAQGSVEFNVKTCYDNNWENSWSALSSGRVNLDYTHNSELIYMSPFSQGRYGNSFRLQYHVDGELKNAKFYAYISNQPYIPKRLSFVNILSPEEPPELQED